MGAPVAASAAASTRGVPRPGGRTHWHSASLSRTVHTTATPPPGHTIAYRPRRRVFTKNQSSIPSLDGSITLATQAKMGQIIRNKTPGLRVGGAPKLTHF